MKYALSVMVLFPSAVLISACVADGVAIALISVIVCFAVAYCGRLGIRHIAMTTIKITAPKPANPIIFFVFDFITFFILSLGFPSANAIGMSFGDMYKFDPVQMDNFNNDPAQWRAPGAETFAQCTERIVSVVTEIAVKNDGKTVAVVSHGMAIRSLLAHILGVASRDIPSLPHGDNTAVSKLIFDNGAFSVEYYNDNSHLPPELSTFARQSWWKKETRGADPNNLYYEPLDPNREGETYKEFYAASWKAAHGDLKGFYPETYLASARRHFAANGKAILKAYRSDGELAGIVETDTERSEGAGVGWISLVYIKEHLRGRGLGTQLVGRAITNYEMLGRQKVRLHVSSENASAIKFYEDLGFEILGSEPGAGAPLYLMEKRFE